MSGSEIQIAEEQNDKNTVAGRSTHELLNATQTIERPNDKQLLDALWRTPNQYHQIGVLDAKSNKFNHLQVKDAAEAIAQAFALSRAGKNTYFACAEYLSSDNRTAANVIGAWAFWVDIDVGPDKAAKGYVTIEDAKTALLEFCKRAGIPEPTHLVASGSGIHAYWALTSSLEREAWQQLAQKFKGLTQALGLRADPSRTADIASVLRPPGTLNFKYNPPKPVTLIHAAEGFIDTEVMKAAIEAAFEKHCSSSIDFDQATESVSPSPVAVPVSDAYIEPPNLLQLASALTVLDPDCDEKTWKFYRIGPMAYAARAIPEIHDQLKTIARHWSSGELRGIPSNTKWLRHVRQADVQPCLEALSHRHLRRKARQSRIDLLPRKRSGLGLYAGPCPGRR